MKLPNKAYPDKLDRSSGFTLVELLVTILIIAVLAAILMVATTSARRSADNSVCLSNLRNIGIGIELYTQDRNGILPAANFGPPNNKPPLEMFQMVLPEYVYGSDATRDANGKVSVSSGTTFTCPAAQRQFKADSKATTYGFNHAIRFQGSGSANAQNLNKINVVNPTKTMIMMDGCNAWYGQTSAPSAYWFWEVVENGDRRPTKNKKKNDFVHGGKVNVLFVDGHTEARTANEIPTDGNNIFWKINGTP